MNDASMTIDPDSSASGRTAPVWKRIADELAAAIARGEPPKGAALPSATELATRYGVHRHTVRQAFRHLQSLGLVIVKQGSGTFVTEGPLPYRIGRKVSFRENVGAAGLTGSAVIVDATIKPADEETAAALAVAPGAPVWRIRTVHSADGRPISAAVHRVCAERFPSFAADLAAGDVSVSVAFRRAGIAAYRRLSTRVSARTAKPKERKALDIGTDEVVLVSKGTDGLPDGTPIHLVETSFAANRIEFVIEAEA